jgi:ferritin
MNIKDFIERMQADLKNEYEHMLFYLHASVVLSGPERIFALPWLTGKASEEMNHVREFSNKIASFGKIPIGSNGFQFNAFQSLEAILDLALSLENQVVQNYHKRLKEAQSLYEETGKYYDLVVFYEEQLEHSQADIDEILKMRNKSR